MSITGVFCIGPLIDSQIAVLDLRDLRESNIAILISGKFRFTRIRYGVITLQLVNITLYFAVFQSLAISTIEYVSDIYRLIHALFHNIRTVITPNDRYRSEGLSPSVDIGRGMITVQK
jgi:hypothetical protein